MRLLPALCFFGSALGASEAYALQKMAVTVGADIPHIISGEVDLLYTPKWTVGLNAGGFAYTFQGTNPTPASIEAGSAVLRFAPFQGSFFLGIAVGIQKMAASHSETFTVNVSGQDLPVPAASSGSLLTPYITPKLGWFVVTQSGFTFGFELGVQFAFHASSAINVSIDDPTLSQYLTVLQATTAYQNVESDVKSKIEKYGTIPLPSIQIRVGWAF